MNVQSPPRPSTTVPTERDLPPLRTVQPGPAGAGPGPDSEIRSGDGPAVASFVLGLVGLLVMNIVLGPLAIALAVLALLRGTGRRGRALLGLGLGVADLAVLAVLVTTHGTVSWSFG